MASGDSSAGASAEALCEFLQKSFYLDRELSLVSRATAEAATEAARAVAEAAREAAEAAREAAIARAEAAEAATAEANKRTEEAIAEAAAATRRADVSDEAKRQQFAEEKRVKDALKAAYDAELPQIKQALYEVMGKTVFLFTPSSFKTRGGTIDFNAYVATAKDTFIPFPTKLHSFEAGAFTTDTDEAGESTGLKSAYKRQHQLDETVDDNDILRSVLHKLREWRTSYDEFLKRYESINSVEDGVDDDFNRMFVCFKAFYTKAQRETKGLRYFVRVSEVCIEPPRTAYGKATVIRQSRKVTETYCEQVKNEHEEYDITGIIKPHVDQRLLKSEASEEERKMENTQKAQELMYEDISFMVDAALPEVGQGGVGQNALIMCYGESGSGKTFTMIGDEDKKGILYRVIDQIHEKQCVVHLQAVQIFAVITRADSESTPQDYRFSDILNDRTYRQTSRWKETTTGITFPEKTEAGADVTVVSIAKNERDTIQQTIQKLTDNREVMSTNANPSSSRTHLMIKIKITGKSKNYGDLILMDLAGYENNDGYIQKYINTSTIGKYLIKTFYRNQDAKGGDHNYAGYEKEPKYSRSEFQNQFVELSRQTLYASDATANYWKEQLHLFLQYMKNKSSTQLAFPTLNPNETRHLTKALSNIYKGDMPANYSENVKIYRALQMLDFMSTSSGIINSLEDIKTVLNKKSPPKNKTDNSRSLPLFLHGNFLSPARQKETKTLCMVCVGYKSDDVTQQTCHPNYTLIEKTIPTKAGLKAKRSQSARSFKM